MGDSNAAGAKTILRSGTNSAAKATVAAAFTRAGTVKKGVSQTVLGRAKAVLATARNRKIAGRKRRQGNAAAKAKAAEGERRQARQNLSRLRTNLRGE